MGALTPLCPQELCWHSLHEHLERAVRSLSGSVFIKSLSVRFSLSNLQCFPPGTCFDFFFSAVSKSSGFAWKVIYPRLCFSVYEHVLQCIGKKHKEHWAVQGLGLMQSCWRSHFQELGALSDPARTNCKSQQPQWAGISLAKGSLDAPQARKGHLERSPKAFAAPKGQGRWKCPLFAPSGESPMANPACPEGTQQPGLPGEAVPVPTSPALLLPHPWEHQSLVLTVLKPPPSHPWAALM